MKYLVAASLAALLPACAELKEQYAYRYGPEPVPSFSYTSENVTRQSDIVAALAIGAGFSPERRPHSSEDFYQITLVGLNVVDDACARYIQNLWKLEHQRERTKDILSATASAVAGIIGATYDPHAGTLTILAQAFGLAAAVTNAVADSYLYTQRSPTVTKLVDKSTRAYRIELEKKRGTFYQSPANVYLHVRQYLYYCLPTTIQAQIESLVADAVAVTPKPVTVGPNPTTPAPVVVPTTPVTPAPASTTGSRAPGPRRDPSSVTLVPGRALTIN